MLALTVACIVAVLVAVWARIAHASGEHAALRAPATALAVITPVGLAIFTLAGPLQSGWARRAGTPASLLGSAPAPASSSSASSASSSSGAGASSLSQKFNSTLSGTVTETPEPGGAIVDLSLQVSGRVHGLLRVRLGGVPVGGSGLSMTGSQVDFAPAGAPAVLQGRIAALQGEEFTARVSDGSGTVLDLRSQLQIDNSAGTVTGTLSGSPAGSNG
jgi:hypothetical protein